MESRISHPPRRGHPSPAFPLAAAALLGALLLPPRASGQAPGGAPASPGALFRLPDPPAPAAAVSARDEGLLEQLVEEALAANPEIRAARARLEASRERPPQAGSLPDPLLSTFVRNVGFPRVSLGDEMMTVAGVRFTQGIPYPGKRPLRRAVAERASQVAAARLELVRRRVIREVAEAFYGLDYVHRALEIVDQTKALLEDLERTTEARYAVGEGIQQDVLKAQVEISVLLNRIVVLEQERESFQTRINRLLNRPVDTAVPAPEVSPAPPWQLELEALLEEARRASALLRERALQVERDRVRLTLAERERLPDLQIASAWLSRGQLPDMWEVNLGISLPIYRSSKQERAVAEAQSELRATRMLHLDAAVQVSAAVRDQFLRAERAFRLLNLFRDGIIPQAILSLESAMAGYEVGKVDFLTVLDNVVTLLTYQLEYHRQRTDYLQALSRLEEHLGRSLGASPATIYLGSEARPGGGS